MASGTAGRSHGGVPPGQPLVEHVRHDHVRGLRVFLAVALDARTPVLWLALLLGLPALDRHRALLHGDPAHLHAVPRRSLVRLWIWLRSLPAPALRLDRDVEWLRVVHADDLRNLGGLS